MRRRKYGVTPRLRTNHIQRSGHARSRLRQDRAFEVVQVISLQIRDILTKAEQYAPHTIPFTA